jgi:hypothetical protein
VILIASPIVGSISVSYMLQFSFRSEGPRARDSSTAGGDERGWEAAKSGCTAPTAELGSVVIGGLEPAVVRGLARLAFRSSFPASRAGPFAFRFALPSTLPTTSAEKRPRDLARPLQAAADGFTGREHEWDDGSTPQPTDLYTGMTRLHLTQ